MDLSRRDENDVRRFTSAPLDYDILDNLLRAGPTILTLGATWAGIALAQRTGIFAFAALGPLVFTALNAIAMRVVPVSIEGHDNRRAQVIGMIFGLVCAALVIVAGAIR